MCHIDVEQGDATLFISPSGRTMLIGSGRNGDGKRIKAVMQQAGFTFANEDCSGRHRSLQGVKVAGP